MPELDKCNQPERLLNPSIRYPSLCRIMHRAPEEIGPQHVQLLQEVAEITIERACDLERPPIVRDRYMEMFSAADLLLSMYAVNHLGDIPSLAEVS